MRLILTLLMLVAAGCDGKVHQSIATASEADKKIAVMGRVFLEDPNSLAGDSRLIIEFRDVSDKNSVSESASSFPVIKVSKKTIFPTEFKFGYSTEKVVHDGEYIFRARIMDMTKPIWEITHASVDDVLFESSGIAPQSVELTLVSVSAGYLSNSSNKGVVSYKCGNTPIAARFLKAQAFVLTPIGVVALDKIRSNKQPYYVQPSNPDMMLWIEDGKTYFEYFGALLGECIEVN